MRMAASLPVSTKPLGAISSGCLHCWGGEGDRQSLLRKPAAMPGGSNFTELRSKASGNISQVGKQMFLHGCRPGEHKPSSPHSSFYSSWWAGQQQALPLCLLKNKESSLAANTMS